MVELPEIYVLADQASQTFVGKVIMNVTVNASPHKFAWFSDDPDKYHEQLSGKKITATYPGTGYTSGALTEVVCEDMLLAFSTPLRYHPPGDSLPKRHQLLIEFDDSSYMSATVNMWGSIHCYPKARDDILPGSRENIYPSPLDDRFDEAYFEKLLSGVKRNISAKAFLATEQRIRGLGNGVLQDILWNARINPKTKLEKLCDTEIAAMLSSVKNTLTAMAAQGGRDTEKDLFGASGGYKTILSNKTLNKPCPACSGTIARESYLGGNVYYCPVCQPYIK